MEIFTLVSDENEDIFTTVRRPNDFFSHVRVSGKPWFTKPTFHYGGLPAVGTFLSYHYLG